MCISPFSPKGMGMAPWTLKGDRDGNLSIIFRKEGRGNMHFFILFKGDRDGSLDFSSLDLGYLDLGFLDFQDR